MPTCRRAILPTNKIAGLIAPLRLRQILDGDGNNRSRDRDRSPKRWRDRTRRTRNDRSRDCLRNCRLKRDAKNSSHRQVYPMPRCDASNRISSTSSNRCRMETSSIAPVNGELCKPLSRRAPIHNTDCVCAVLEFVEETESEPLIHNCARLLARDRCATICVHPHAGDGEAVLTIAELSQLAVIESSVF